MHCLGSLLHQNTAGLTALLAYFMIQSNQNEWKQFVSNRVAKIKEKKNIVWRHCPGIHNPADIGSRGTSNLPPCWLEGPEWLKDHNKWPRDVTTFDTTKDMLEERKLIKEIHLSANNKGPLNAWFSILRRYKLAKVLRITS